MSNIAQLFREMRKALQMSVLNQNRYDKKEKFCYM